jgi:hypothetical protein
MGMVLVDIQYMVELLMIKILLENIRVLDYFLWLIVEEIRTLVNFLLHLKPVRNLIKNMWYLDS